MIAKCPFCAKEHNSEEYDIDWYFVCCATALLVWRETKEGLILDWVEENNDG